MGKEVKKVQIGYKIFSIIMFIIAITFSYVIIVGTGLHKGFPSYESFSIFILIILLFALIFFLFVVLPIYSGIQLWKGRKSGITIALTFIIIMIILGILLSFVGPL